MKLLLSEWLERARGMDEPVKNCGGPDGEPWLVACSQPHKEAVATSHLQRQGFESFCPRYFRTRRHARRIDRVLAPLFPGYLFVRAGLASAPVRAINSTVGIRHLLTGEGGLPRRMPAFAMRSILERCDNGILNSVLPRLDAGMEVRMIDGAFVDMMARIETLDERGRVTVLLNLLGSERRVVVKPAMLAIA